MSTTVQKAIESVRSTLRFRTRLSAISVAASPRCGCLPGSWYADRSQGVQLGTIEALASYWASEYDSRKAEAKLNT